MKYNRFSTQDVNRKNLFKLLKESKKQHSSFYKNRRDESHKKYLDEISKQETFDRSLINQKEYLSPTTKSNSKSFQRLEEQRDDFWFELQEIIDELEKE